ncbi:hypothetical protein TVAG_292510 [Trichomonas vaginalis G3]|uniref:Ribosomal RNA-processing protein 8 n=1 Tax=Trichomonas vaginalis (strain ATCC PRA-98 / G3) TaxID=412133 RepID=A2F0C3_TRIV3|nr:chromatin silencing at rDNA [Trichomonas vaginalis G3]EAY01618.1 hypothetical protein TVAG_292510 [Trichomonas vaginalis G3]KAI5551582.1 chromatin silencing at rDNA [Trichomonas vaginalis G3]|eukprot:XP_001314235.1 hypothetical protein [Trichomonas vaginalis G3]
MSKNLHKKSKEHFKKAPKKALNDRQQLEGSKFRMLNEKLYTCTSTEAKEFFDKQPQYFNTMHDGFQIQAKTWPIVPVDAVIDWIKNSIPKTAVIADMGCGDAKIAATVPNTVHSFDFKARNSRVTQCDMSHTPLEDKSVDVVVFVLSLMGTNVSDFIREANRILKPNGKLLVVEVTSRIENADKFANGICAIGFDLTKKKDLTTHFTWFEFKKGAPKNVSGDLTLAPCIYKRR